MLRILDLPEPLLPISRTLRFLVFLTSADRPAEGVLALALAVVGGVAISKWNSDSVETVPREEQLADEDEREGEGQVRERCRGSERRPRCCRSRSSSRSANWARGLTPSTSVGKVPCEKGGGVSVIVAQVVCLVGGEKCVAQPGLPFCGGVLVLWWTATSDSPVHCNSDSLHFVIVNSAILNSTFDINRRQA